MRKIFLLSVLAAFIAPAFAQKDSKKKVEGSGNVTSRSVTVQSFDQLDINGVFSVQLTQGASENVKIEADDNLQGLIHVKNDGSKLSISMDKDVQISTKSKMKVYVTFKKLNSMDLKTVGDVTSEGNLSFTKLDIDNKSVGDVNLNFTAESVRIDNKSVGDVKLEGKATDAVIKNKSVGSFQAASFVVQNMDIDNDGVGSAEVNATKELKVKDSFLGKVTNKGSATPKRTKKITI